MKKSKTPAPGRAGTAKDISVEQALAVIGDDPDTMLLVIALMDRMLAKRRTKRTKHRLTS